MTYIDRAQQVLTSEATAILSLKLTKSFDAAIGCLLACGGKVITTGMGKAGSVAQRFAAALCSTATPAVYLHPGEAAHGDLGV